MVSPFCFSNTLQYVKFEERCWKEIPSPYIQYINISRNERKSPIYGFTQIDYLLELIVTGKNIENPGTPHLIILR